MLLCQQTDKILKLSLVHCWTIIYLQNERLHQQVQERVLSIFQLSHGVSGLIKNGRLSSSSLGWKWMNSIAIHSNTVSMNVSCYQTHCGWLFCISETECRCIMYASHFNCSSVNSTSSLLIYAPPAPYGLRGHDAPWFICCFRQ